MAGTSPTRPHEHDRVRLLASPPHQSSGSEKREPKPAATADLTGRKAGDPDPAPPASATDMPALPWKTMATHDPQKSAKIVLITIGR